MKIALAQLNYTIGDFEANKAKIIDNIETACRDGVELIIFSELAVCGYPPLDLLTRETFVKKALITLDEIAAHCKNIAAIVGCPSINPNSQGKQLYNSAWLLHEGKAVAVAHKTLLPTYDVFDEYRYFQPNQQFDVVVYKGKRIAITICEDLWDDQTVEAAFTRNKLYTLSPMQKLSTLRPDFVVNIAASPFSHHQYKVRSNVICRKAVNYKLPIFYVNQTGANSELIFDGGSMVINADGNIAHHLKYFAEELLITSLSQTKCKGNYSGNENETALIHDALVLGIRDYFHKSGLSKAILGLSGGLDSAVTAALAVAALGKENVHGLLLPSQYSSDHSITDAIAVADNLGMSYDVIPIKDAYKQIETTLSPLFAERQPDVTEENIQARIRAVLLMAYSNKFGNILLNTSNKSEAAVGYGTLYGDMCGGLSVLGDVYKTQVYKLAHYINSEKEIIPHNTIVKPPSAELRPDQKDSDSLPEYEILDAVLFRYIELNLSIENIIDDGYDAAIVQRTIAMLHRNEYKRFQCPPILRVTGKAFGAGLRMPLVGKS